MSTSVEQVRQWNHGASRRLVWLLAALSTPALIAPDPVDITFAANAPEITVAASPNIATQTRVMFIETVRVVRAQNRAQWLSAVVTASADEPEITTRTRYSYAERVRLISSQKVNGQRFLIASGVEDPNAIYPPTLSIEFQALAPTIQSFELIPCALHDDGHWEPPGIFVQPRSGVPLALDVLEQHVSPQSLAITFAALAPTITASSNALVSPTTPAIVFTPYTPTILIDGAPIITPATLGITFTPHAPTISAYAAPDVPDKVGGDDVYHRRPVERVEVVERANRNLDKGTLKLRKERALENELRDLYRTLTEDPKVAEIAERIVAPVAMPLKVTDAPLAAPVETPTPERLMAAFTAKVVAEEPAAVEAEIALRLLARLREEQDADDQAALELIFNHLI